MASTERSRPSVAAPLGSLDLEVLLSTVQKADVESTLNILHDLDELLATGSDHRIRCMISKGASEAMLNAFVNAGRNCSPNYAILVPLLNMLAKVGHRDRQIGRKAEKAGAVLLTLDLLKLNVKHARRTAACLRVIQVLSLTAVTANLIGENQGLDVIYGLLPQYATKHLHILKAAIYAFAALLCTKANICLAVSKGYISGLLELYEEWHSKDTHHTAIEICHALLHCLHKVTKSTAGSQAFISLGGINQLYRTSQKCLLSKSLKSLVEPSVQLMRKCLPRTPLPLTKDKSAYTFPLPGRPVHDIDVASEENNDESDEEKTENHQDADSRDYDDDLETDVNKLCECPDPDRPKELLPQYRHLCPELSHDFQELDSSSEPEESSTASSSSPSDEEVRMLNSFFPRASRREKRRSSTNNDSSTSFFTASSETEMSSEGHKTAAAPLKTCNFHSHSNILSASPSFTTMVIEAKHEVPLSQKEVEQNDVEKESESFYHPSMIDRLLERHKICIPHHEPKLYCAAAAKTRSVPGFNILAFPDFWGHVPPPGPEPMAPRKSDIQRQKVFEDVQRFLNTEDIINKVVFDLENDSIQCPSECLRFYSKFECGNLRKAIQVRRYEYDLILNADTNSSQHAQWFYFEVSNMVADVPYRFNVINCEKTNSQFNYGMQPVLYSVKEALEGRPHWVRSGAEICYFRNHFCPAQGSKRTTFYTLTFTITFKYNEDVCYLAYHYPYTYSALKAHLNVLQKSVDPAKVFFRHQILCSTLAGNPCPVVTITACPASRAWRDMNQFRNRPCIVLSGRVHPGESNASWMMKGTLEFLCSSDLVAQSLREAFVFKIIPMLNPDGVINGMNRCDLNCEDLNRQWCKPDPVLSPTIYHTKGLLYYLKSIGRTPLVFCDYHGHSRKKNVFLYGCSVKETLWESGSEVDTVGLKEDPGYRTIAKTLDRIAPAFSFNSCNYLVEKSRSATARVVVWREMGVLRSYTMETTYNGFNQGIYKGLQIGTKELKEMGIKFCQSLLSVTKDTRSLYSRTLINHIDGGHNILDHKSHNCFEDDEPPCVEEIEYSNECLSLKSTYLDFEANINVTSSDEEQSSDKAQTEPKQLQNSVGHVQDSSMKSLLCT